MCIGVPMTVLRTEGLVALCDGPNSQAWIDLALIGPVPPGTDILAHVGTAIRVLEPGERGAIGDALEAVRLAAQGRPFAHLLADLIDREPQLPPHLQPPSVRQRSD